MSPTQSAISICLLGLLLTGCTAGQVPPLQRSQATLNALIADLDANRIDGIEVFYIPASVQRFEAVTPDGLKVQYHYRILIQQTGVSALTPGLLDVLHQTRLKQATLSSDVRWGVVFKLTQGVHREIYMDRTTHTGIVDGTHVELGERLSAWLQHLTANLP